MSFANEIAFSPCLSNVNQKVFAGVGEGRVCHFKILFGITIFHDFRFDIKFLRLMWRHNSILLVTLNKSNKVDRLQYKYL